MGSLSCVIGIGFLATAIVDFAGVFWQYSSILYTAWLRSPSTSMVWMDKGGIVAFFVAR